MCPPVSAVRSDLLRFPTTRHRHESYSVTTRELSVACDRTCVRSDEMLGVNAQSA
jgi:hypothetical protein